MPDQETGLRRTYAYRNVVAQFMRLAQRDGTERILAAEVGVWDGDSSAYFLTSVPNLVLTMVDLWQPIPEDHPYKKAGDGVSRASADKMEWMMRLAYQRTEFAADRRYIVRAESTAVARDTAPGFFDLVFIDAAHDYESVLADCRAWWHTVRPGGTYCGHDYKKRTPGVVQAVNEFAEEVGVRLWKNRGKIWSMEKP